MIVTQREVRPDALLMAAGGSIAAAMEITTAVIQRVVEMGATKAYGLRAYASWVAHLDVKGGVDVVDWDPSTPIPEGAFLLRCTGYSVAIDG